jgi:hypothetical protein
MNDIDLNKIRDDLLKFDRLDVLYGHPFNPDEYGQKIIGPSEEQIKEYKKSIKKEKIREFIIDMSVYTALYGGIIFFVTLYVYLVSKYLLNLL